MYQTSCVALSRKSLSVSVYKVMLCYVLEHVSLESSIETLTRR